MHRKQNIWATQEKNEDIFNEAFHNCRHVILIFSINKSMAFQGYVRTHVFLLPSPLASLSLHVLLRTQYKDLLSPLFPFLLSL